MVKITLTYIRMIKPIVKRIKVIKKVQDVFTSLSPYVLSISLNMDFMDSEDDNLKFDVIALFPANWKLLDSEDFGYGEVDNNGNAIKYKFYLTNNTLIVDDLLVHIQNIINSNTELEQKERKLNELIEKERIAFDLRIAKLKENLLK